VTYDVVQVRGCSVKGHVNIVSANVEILVVERLVDIAHKLGEIDKLLGAEFWSFGPRWQENVPEKPLERHRPISRTVSGKCGKVGRRGLREEAMRSVTTYVDNHLGCLVRIDLIGAWHLPWRLVQHLLH
jgi:hypothetical protein